jgi:hypothetical protein
LGLKRDVTGGHRKLNNKELHNFRIQQKALLCLKQGTWDLQHTKEI